MEEDFMDRENQENNNENTTRSASQQQQMMDEDVEEDKIRMKKKARMGKDGNIDETLTTSLGIVKKDLVRIILQSMNDLGFSQSAKALEQESGISLQAPQICSFQNGILEGQWSQVLDLLPDLQFKDEENLKNAKFLILKQKFLEQLEQGSVQLALETLRKEITPLKRDTDQLHKLTAFIMCSKKPDDLRAKAQWDGAAGSSRRKLLNDLHKYISPSLFIPERRLENLLLQAVKNQASKSNNNNNNNNNGDIFGNEIAGPISLLEAQVDPKTLVPLHRIKTIEKHTDEVWFCCFSPNGEFFATASKDSTVNVYDVAKLRSEPSPYSPIVCRSSSQEPVSFLAWSPDSTMLLACGGADASIRLFHPRTGKIKQIFQKHTDSVPACAWFPDNAHFLSCGSGKDKTFRKWHVGSTEPVSSWKVEHRIQDMVLSLDGKFVIAIGPSERKIFVYDAETEKLAYTLPEYETTTSLALSPCGRFLLVNLSREDGRGCVRLWSLEKKRLVREFTGHMILKYVLRAAFGGDSLVATGSEDCKVFVYHRQTAEKLAELSGHVGSVNAVAFNPVDPRMMISASDDNTIIIWGTKELAENFVSKK